MLAHSSMENDLMRVHRYWLEYDAAALAFLVVGIAVVGLIAVII